ncbi:hypothetical protein [Streptomyces sp. BPTC-684]|uniref:hypothetical protein n=1 Tax=Streptomyces sp. BPTC-684 TaxID=3043734 RepID=UPI0024B14F35|nr:hypothetical protein [Streptomyces sp. BPTC-684]WHM41099.1 hypothetical protein QIY60_32415 [Streptomyces sp. BPTC-684]
MSNLLAWYGWMAIGAVLAIAGTYWLTGSLAAIKPKPADVCSWCSRASGHQVTGHTYETCRGPADAQLAEQRRLADRKSAKARDEEYATQEAARKAAERARHATKLRVLQIGTVTTRTGPQGNEIHTNGWAFDTLASPHSGPSNGTTQAYSTTGGPERISGWTIQELHTIAHGGACQCDVIRLARYARR